MDAAQRAMVFVDAAEEFAPAFGSPPFFLPDSPTSAADALLAIQTRWAGSLQCT